MSTFTYQDFVNAKNRSDFIIKAISNHKNSDMYRIACLADLYDHQLNATINNYIKVLFTLSGNPVEDYTASNNKIACNLFNRLNTQRCMYSLGNGVSFLQPDENGEDKVKARLGRHFDHDIKEAAYYALIHGISFPFWNMDKVHLFKLTEFVPLWDEETGELRAGIRFWQLASDKPMTVVVYEEDGYTKYRAKNAEGALVEVEEKRAYKTTYSFTPADEMEVVVGEENYSKLPIVPMWASRLKQSTLVGMMEAIDSYDLIRSGFANDLTDCSMIYWIVENYGGMDDADLAKFRDTIKFQHIASLNTSQGGKVTPYTQEIPYQAREAYLKEIRNGIYEDFGALDVHTVAAGATNDHIDAAYQPLDENADDFEFWVGECIQQILSLIGIEDYPEFKRNRISNLKEQVEIIVQESQWLDQQTILRKLPNISAEEIASILQQTDDDDLESQVALPESEQAEE